MIKINNKTRGENASEQLALERKRFKARLKRQEETAETRKYELLQMDDGLNCKLA